MRILYLSQYFPPEAGATQTRAYEMAHNFVLQNAPTTVIAEFPNHPSGVIPARYRGQWIERENLDGIEVIRVWVKASPKKNFLNRMWFYISYMVNATLAGVFLTHGRFNLIYCSSPPLFAGGAGLALSRMKRAPLVFEVRDMWPESAVALGELNNPFAIRLASRLEEACYRRARRIIVVTRGIYDRLLERGIPEGKIALVPNGANTEMFQFDPKQREALRARLNLQDKFVLVYAGIFGIAQGLETIVEAAQALRADPSIHFLLIGDGPRREEIIHLAEHYRLTNLAILPEQPRQAIPAYLSASDVALAPLKNVEIFRGALPSKIFDAWACSRPVLLSIDGEARRLVEQVEGGIYVPPESVADLTSAIRQIKNSPEQLRRMGENGLAYTKANLSRKALAEKLLAILQESCPGS